MHNPSTTAKNEGENKIGFDNNPINPNMGANRIEGEMGGQGSAFGTQSEQGGAAKAFAGTVTSLKDGVSHLTHRAQEKVTVVAKNAQEYGEKAVEETRSYVRRNPGQALLIGFGAGLLIGFSFSRR